MTHPLQDDPTTIRREDPFRDPVRDPRSATPAERARRAAILILLTLFVPGGAQAVAGNRRLGRLALRVTLAVWAVLAVVVVLAVVSRATLVSVVSNDLVLVPLIAVLVALALGWALLWVDTFRLIRLHLLAPRARTVTAAATALALVLTSGGLVYGAWATNTGRGALDTVFGDGPPVAASDGRYNILVMGGDAGEGRVGLRPDSMHVVSVEEDSGAVTVLSLPRNLQNAPFTEGSPLWDVYPSGYDCGDDCILNALYGEVEDGHPELYPDAEHPGAEAMMDAAGGVLGIEVSAYALMDMAGFAQLIDAMGGVDITSGGYVTYRGVRPDGEWGNAWWTPGAHHFDGEQALAFARSRKWSSDYSRIRRQQCMQAAMLDQFTPATLLTRFESLVDAGQQIVTTSIPRDQLGTFVDLADRSRGHDMARLTIGAPDFGDAGDHFTTDPDYDLVHERVDELLAQEPTAQAAGAPETPAVAAAGASALPVLTVLSASASETAGVDLDDPDTWPAPPVTSSGEAFTAEDLMAAEDAGQEDVLAHAAGTNEYCTAGG